MNITIPCDTLVRLASIIKPDAEAPFHAVRFDNGQVLATDRRIMSIYNMIPSFTGIAHIVPDAALIEHCATEAEYNGTVTIVVTDMLEYTVAKTSMGFISGNLWHRAPPSELDRWREVVGQAGKEGQARNSGGMFWAAAHMSRLADTAPSGKVVFPENINTEWPTLMRDPNSMDWCGVFTPNPDRKAGDKPVMPAVMPDWLRV